MVSRLLSLLVVCLLPAIASAHPISHARYREQGRTVGIKLRTRTLGTVDLRLRVAQASPPVLRENGALRTTSVSMMRGSARIRRHGITVPAALTVIGRNGRLQFSSRNVLRGLEGASYRGLLSLSGRRVELKSLAGLPERSTAARGMSCATRSSNRVATELRPGALAVTGPKVTIGLIADYDYFLSRGADLSRAQSDALSTMNAALAVLAAQLGISFDVASLDVYTSRESDPFPASIADLAQLLEAMPSLIPSASVIHHLMTGREDAFTSAVGIAYGAAVCGPFSYSVSQEVHPSLDFLVTAHEIAHNLGAAHDESGESLMFPSVLPTTFVSELSRSEISAHLASVSCLPSVSFEPPPIPTVSPFPSLETFETRAVLTRGGKLEVELELGGDVDPDGLVTLELGLTPEMESVLVSTTPFGSSFTSRVLTAEVASPTICKKRQKRKRGCVSRKKAKRPILPRSSDRVVYLRVKLAQYRSTTTYLGPSMPIPIVSARETKEAFASRLASLLEQAIASSSGG